MRTNKMYEEVRIKVAKEALSGIKIGALGSMYEVNLETIRKWVREYRDQIRYDFT